MEKITEARVFKCSRIYLLNSGSDGGEIFECYIHVCARGRLRFETILYYSKSISYVHEPLDQHKLGIHLC
jgi:hypothetical protein